MNKLPVSERATILSMLAEGMSMSFISCTTGVSIDTDTKLPVDEGHACAVCHNETVRNVKTRRVQCVETWFFCYAKERNVRETKAATVGAGEVRT